MALAACAALIVGIAGGRGGASAGADANTVVVREEDGRGVFDPRVITIATGESVTWSFQGQIVHTVTSDTLAFDSGIRFDGVYEVQFTTPGTYAYYCTLHGAPGGVGHSGTVIVEAATATPAPTATSTPLPRSCLTLGQKISLILGIVRNFGEEPSSGSARYDVNGDGAIDGGDVREVADRPLCNGRGR